METGAGKRRGRAKVRVHVDAAIGESPDEAAAHALVARLLGADGVAEHLVLRCQAVALGLELLELHVHRVIGGAGLGGVNARLLASTACCLGCVFWRDVFTWKAVDDTSSATRVYLTRVAITRSTH